MQKQIITENQMPPTKSAERIQLLLAQKGWNESELARYSGVPQPTVHRYASGGTENPRKPALIKIAKAFNVPFTYISGDDDSYNPYANGPREPHGEYSTLPPAAEKLIARIKLLAETKSLRIEDYKLIETLLDRLKE